MHADLATLRGCLNLRAGSDLGGRQSGKGCKVDGARSRRVRVVGSLPIKRGERGGYPVEVAADDMARSIRQRQINEKNPVRSGVEAIGYVEYPLRTVGSCNDRRVHAVQVLPCQVVYMETGMQPSNRLIGAVDDHDRPIVVRILNVQRLTGLFG